MTKRIIYSFLFLLAGTSAFAKVVLPAIFTDNLVLQRNSEVSVWGWGGAGETLKITGTWSKTDTVTTKVANNGKWITKIRTGEAGGPYMLSVIGSSRVDVNNVLLGEVWLCSGQSNMEWSINAKVFKGDEEAAAANNANIRFFDIPHMGADNPQEDVKASWTVCNPQTVRTTSAVGYFFAKEIQKNLNVPVGIINSSWGGTPAEVWIPKEAVENDPVLKANAYTDKFDWWPGVAGTTYNGMIAPLKPYGIAGALWYQGESNVGKAKTYSQLMQTLINSWRSDFGKEFPFYYVQIAPYTYGEGSKSQLLREQQAKLLDMLPKTGMVVISDLVDDIKDIHPKNKIDVGKRLANLAMAETYGKTVGAYKSPMYKSMKAENGKVKLTFDNAATGFKAKNKTISGFKIAGDDKNFVDAKAEVKGNTIVVSSPQVKNPSAVRFGFDNTSMADIFGKEGLPVAPFRTDDWDK